MKYPWMKWHHLATHFIASIPHLVEGGIALVYKSHLQVTVFLQATFTFESLQFSVTQAKQSVRMLSVFHLTKKSKTERTFSNSISTVIFNSGIQHSMYSFLCFISVCPFVVLLKATYAEIFTLFLSCRPPKRGRGFMMSSPCLESLSYPFLLLAHFPELFP